MLPLAFSASGCVILLGLNEPKSATAPSAVLSCPRRSATTKLLNKAGFPLPAPVCRPGEGVSRRPPQNVGLCWVLWARGHIHSGTAPPSPPNSFLRSLPGQFVPFHVPQPYLSPSPAPTHHPSSKCALPAGVFARVLSPTPQEVTPKSTNSCSSGLISWPP